MKNVCLLQRNNILPTFLGQQYNLSFMNIIPVKKNIIPVAGTRFLSHELNLLFRNKIPAKCKNHVKNLNNFCYRNKILLINAK